MKQYKVCLTIAGSDPSGGAGIQADIKTMTLLGCYAQAVPTCLTVQNTLGVQRSIPIDAELVFDQAAVTMEDCMPQCVKIGIVPNLAIAHAIADSKYVERTFTKYSKSPLHTSSERTAGRPHFV